MVSFCHAPPSPLFINQRVDDIRLIICQLRLEIYCAYSQSLSHLSLGSNYIVTMRAIVQRVLKGSVSAEGDTVGSIGEGLAVLLGISRDDDHTDSDYVIRKLLTLKLFSDDPDKRWQKSVKEANLELLVISQFTLCHTFKGTKPDFHLSMGADQSKPFFEEFISRLKKEYDPSKVQTGKFGAHMNIDLNLDGPVTLVIDSPAKKKPNE